MNTDIVKTQEQLDIIDEAINGTSKILKIDAAAGVGKSTTLVMISEDLIKPSLLIVFNKSAQQSATDMFPAHVECKTSHSLAYSHYGSLYRHKLSRPLGGYVNVAWTGNEISKHLNIESIKYSNGKTVTSAHIGLMVRLTLSKFESSSSAHISMNHIPYGEINSLKRRIVELNQDTNENKLIDILLSYAEKLWEDRVDTNSPVMITHDTYLKMWQLSKPQLPYEIIYLDEAQDSNDCVLDVILNQHLCKKILLVGDENQSIYQWRHAVNAMHKINGKTLNLTKSFRFGQDIADIANKILNKDKVVGFEKIISKVGIEEVNKSKPHTILYRTNACMVLDAVDRINKGESIAIDADLTGFIRKMQSAFSLFLGDGKNVKHEEIIAFDTWGDLLIESEFNGELARIVYIINNKLFDRVVNTLKSYTYVKNSLVYMTTAHKSKGREWDQVILGQDFKSLLDNGYRIQGNDQEENLLYVASTRAKKKLNVNNSVSELCIGEVNDYIDHLDINKVDIISSESPMIPYSDSLEQSQKKLLVCQNYHNFDPDAISEEEAFDIRVTKHRGSVPSDNFPI